MTEKPTQIIVNPHNKKAYLDITRDMLVKGNGLFTFQVRMSGGKIVDYVFMEGKKYAKTVRPK